MARAIETVGVLGLGTMGAGIVEVFARAGLRVIGVDADQPAVERGRAHIERSTGRAVERGRLDAAEQRAIVEHIHLGTSIEEVATADLVVEAIPERMELKRVLFDELARVCEPTAILATNTSSLSVTALAAGTSGPARVIGMHFFNPAPVMRLVEVVTTVVTDAAVVDRVQELARRLGKSPVTVRDRAGFVANFLLFGYLNRAVGFYDAGYAGREDIDGAMTLGCGLPMGPLALLDLIGIDTAYEILQTMYAESGDRMHAPHPLLRQMALAGLLGRKAGRGFYTYQAPGSGTVAGAAPSVPGSYPLPDPLLLVGAGTLADEVAAACREAEVSATPVGPDLRRAADASLILVAQDDPAERPALVADVERAAPDAAVLGVVLGAGDSAEQGITALSTGARRPANVVGVHLAGRRGAGAASSVIEIVPSLSTAEHAARLAADLAGRLGGRPVVCADRSGWLVDALLFPYLNDAARMLDVGYATADDIDAAMTLGCGYPAGPIAMLDQIGLDVALRVQQGIYAETPDPGLKPTPLLRQLVTAGRLGARTGRGVRSHSGSGTGQ